MSSKTLAFMVTRAYEYRLVGRANFVERRISLADLDRVYAGLLGDDRGEDLPGG